MTNEQLRELLEEALHQLWHAINSPERFDREVARQAYRDIRLTLEGTPPEKRAAREDGVIEAQMIDGVPRVLVDVEGSIELREAQYVTVGTRIVGGEEIPIRVLSPILRGDEVLAENIDGTRHVLRRR